MKHYFLLLLFVPFLSTAQKYDTLKNEVSNIIEIQGADRTELYNRSKVALAKLFKSSKDVIQLDDKENGKIIAKGVIPYSARAFKPGTDFTGSFPFMLTIEFKDNKYRYALSDISHSAYKYGRSGGLLSNAKPDCGRGILTLRGWNTIKTIAVSDVISFGASFQKEMERSVSTSKENW